MHAPAPSAELLTLVSIARAAGAEILRVYRGPIAASQKSDATPVTEADTAAERLILTHLAKQWPEIPVIAEESHASGNIPEIGETFFLVDPLDGTKEFIARNGQFTVNIARIVSGVPVTGVIYAPALHEIYCGQSGQGAFAAKTDATTELRWTAISVDATSSNGLVAIASRSHRDAHTQRYLDTLNVSQVIGVGSSLKFCKLATGEAHIYPRFGRTMEWDTAAGQAILEAAGGHVRDVNGVRLTYGKSQANFANPDFIASAT